MCDEKQIRIEQHEIVEIQNVIKLNVFWGGRVIYQILKNMDMRHVGTLFTDGLNMHPESIKKEDDVFICERKGCLVKATNYETVEEQTGIN